VAMQGTAAPTEATLNRLLKRAKKMILCFDADQGGSKAIEQFIKVAGPMACRGQVNIAIAVLPPGTDPDQCIRENLVDMYSVLEDAKPWLDWQLEFWLAGIDRTDTAFFTNVEKNVRKLVESIQSPVLRQYYVDKASRMLALDAKAASKIAKSWAEQLPSVNINKKWSKPSPQQTRRQAEKSLLRLYINVPELREECRPFMSKLHSSNHNWLWGRIVELEQYADPKDLKHCLMAVLSVAEPHYMNRLRSTVEPGIKVLSNPDIMKHISNTLSQELTTNER